MLNSNAVIESDADSLTLGAISMQTYDLTVGSNTGSGHTLINGVISGTSGTFRKSGSNRLTLSGANTYGQVTYIDAGFLILGADNVLPGSAIYFNGGTLDNGGRTDVLGQWSYVDQWGDKWYEWYVPEVWIESVDVEWCEHVWSSDVY